MSIRTRIKNTLRIPCEGVDLTTVSDIEFYIRQLGLFLQYTPVVVSANELLVEIPFEDAMRLRKGEVRLQFAFTDANGIPDASEIATDEAEELLKEAGYGQLKGTK